MEKRTGNVIVQAPGGTAARSASTYKVSLPSAWIKEMGITGDARQVELSFDGTVISISKRRTIQEFMEDCRKRNNEVLILYYYDGGQLCSKIAANDTDQTLSVENFTSDVIRTAFGNNQSPTWDDLQAFLEERCIPRSRAGLREYLETIGVDKYDPLEIIKKTEGRMAEDDQWIKVEVAV